MKILKYKKVKGNEYKIITNKEEYKLYDDIIIKYELLLKKEISEKEFEKVIEENNLLKSYYVALKAINIKMRTEKELENILKKKSYQEKEIKYAIARLQKEGYINHKAYIEAYIHDMLAMNVIGEQKILNDLLNLGFNEQEVLPYLKKIDIEIYLEKIKKYIDKKAKINKKSINEFKRKVLQELINKGFYKNDILEYLNNMELKENDIELEKIVAKTYNKYIKKYDLYTTKNKIKQYLYSKGYTNIDIDKYIEKTSN